MAIQFNLLPWREELRAGRERSSKFFIGAGALCGLLTAGIFYYYNTLVVDDKLKAKQYYSSKILGLAKEKKQKEDLLKFKERISEQIFSIESLRSRRTTMTNVLEKVSSSLPDNLFLKDISIKSNDFKVKGVAVNDEEITKMTRSLDSSSLFGVGAISYSSEKKRANDKIKEFIYETKINYNKTNVAGDENGKK